MPSKQDLCPIHLCHPVTEVTAPHTIYAQETSVNEEMMGGRVVSGENKSGDLKRHPVQLLSCGATSFWRGQDWRMSSVSALQHSQGQLTVILVSLRLSHHTQFTSHRRSQGKPPGTIVLFSQNTDFWLNKSSGFLGQGVWAVDLWGAMNAFGNSCLSINS